MCRPRRQAVPDSPTDLAGAVTAPCAMCGPVSEARQQAGTGVPAGLPGLVGKAPQGRGWTRKWYVDTTVGAMVTSGR
ncbi:hypothetical protein GCM10027294_51540 [Marinactinospora endophytica]